MADLRPNEYGPIDVTLVEQGNTILPEPVFDPEASEIDKLRYQLGWCIAYLQRNCGPVEVPQITIIAIPHTVRGERYAVMVNGSGLHRTYTEAWAYMIDVFDGIEAVYRMSKGDTKAKLPVFMNFEQTPKAYMGDATIINHEKTTEIILRIQNSFTEAVFSGLYGLGFFGISTVKDSETTTE